MTDFDFEILAAIALYGKDGVERSTLEQQHFPGYDLLYTLEELSKPQIKTENLYPGTPINHSFDDSACLKKRVKKSTPNALGLSYEYELYSLTFKGQALLQNWQRRQAEKASLEKKRFQINLAISIAVGLLTGITATVICSKFLEL